MGGHPDLAQGAQGALPRPFSEGIRIEPPIGWGIVGCPVDADAAPRAYLTGHVFDLTAPPIGPGAQLNDGSVTV